MQSNILKILLYGFGSVCSGLLIAFAFPSYNQAWLSWICIVPLLLAVKRLSIGKAFLAGWLTGIVCMLGIFPWINELHAIKKLALGLGYVYLGLYFGLFSAITSFVCKWLALPFLAAAPVWVATEYLRSHFFFLGFPWGLLGHTQYDNLPLIQVASFAGVYGVSFVIILVNGAVADFVDYCYMRNKSVTGRQVAIKYKPIHVGLLVFLGVSVVWFLGWKTVSRDIRGKQVSVALIQGNIPQHIKWDPQSKDYIMSKYERLSEEAARSNPQLIVWPETATPGFVLKNMSLYNKMVAIVKRLKTHFLVGSAEYSKFGKFPAKREISGNTALFFSPQGKVIDQYLKIRLVPLGEYIPYRDIIPWPDFMLPRSKKNVVMAGKESKPFSLGGIKFGTLICWETIFPDLARRMVNNGADFLINISNEAAFGNTSAPYQMLSMGVFRAVENRVHLLRASNTGISCFIDPFGRVTGRVTKNGEELFIEGVSTQTIRISSPGTFYTKHGDIFAFCCLLITAIFISLGSLKYVRSVRGLSSKPSERRMI